MLRFLGFALAVIVASTSAWASVTPNPEIKSLALETLAKAGLQHEGNGVVKEFDTYWTYSEASARVQFDKSRTLIQIENPLIRRRTTDNSTFDPSLQPLPEEQLIELGRDYAARVADASALVQAVIPNKPKIGATPSESRRTVQVLLSTEKQIRTEGIGNYISVVMDCQTGDLWYVRISSGYEYDNLDNLIPEQQAIAVAKAKIGSQETPNIVRLEYKAYTEGEEKRKICRPVYCIFIGNQRVFINAKTGAASEVVQWAIR